MLTYSEYVTQYLNQRNPATGLFWLLADIASATGAPLSLVIEYRNRAQDEHVGEEIIISDSDIEYRDIDNDEIAIIIPDDTACGGRGQPACEDDFIGGDDDETQETVTQGNGMFYLGLAVLGMVLLRK